MAKGGNDMNKRNWTETEEKYIKENFKSKTKKSMAEHLGIDAVTLARKMERMGLRKCPRYLTKKAEKIKKKEPEKKVKREFPPSILQKYLY
jgi:hypothetical protein